MGPPDFGVAACGTATDARAEDVEMIAFQRGTVVYTNDSAFGAFHADVFSTAFPRVVSVEASMTQWIRDDETAETTLTGPALVTMSDGTTNAEHSCHHRCAPLESGWIASATDDDSQVGSSAMFIMAALSRSGRILKKTRYRRALITRRCRLVS